MNKRLTLAYHVDDREVTPAFSPIRYEVITHAFSPIRYEVIVYRQTNDFVDDGVVFREWCDERLGAAGRESLLDEDGNPAGYVDTYYRWDVKVWVAAAAHRQLIPERHAAVVFQLAGEEIAGEAHAYSDCARTLRWHYDDVVEAHYIVFRGSGAQKRTMLRAFMEDARESR